MTENIIFDMGNVLMRWEPETFVKRLQLSDPTDEAFLSHTIFRTEDWPKIDAGLLTEEQLEEKLKKVVPERLHDAMHQLIFHWQEPILPVPGMAEVVKSCHDADMGIYLLSNAGLRQPLFWHEIPGSEWFDGTVISAEVRMVKPQPEIYLHLLEKYHLRAEDCTFVDDFAPNVAAAEALGIRGILFEGDVKKAAKAIFEN